MSDALDLSSLGSIDFTPDWAKKDARVTMSNSRPARSDDRPSGDRRGPGGKPGFKPGFERGKGEFRKPMRKGFDRRPAPAERPQPLDVEVKVLPETKALGTIIRKLQGDFHAYKLKDLAYFFLDNPQSVLLRISSKDATKPLRFFQCKACGFAALKEEDVLAHIVTAHLGDYYASREVDCEPPKGTFTCVAKCGLSGVLLGPPNVHEFNAVVREMIRTRYPEMSEEQYRAHIEMVRDAESIEAWRAGAVKKTVYVATSAGEGAPELTREAAEGEFRRTILPSLVEAPKQLMITAEAAMKSPVRPLQWAVRDALERERRSPYAMCFALRGAFHHRKLHFFRANDAKGPEFVTGVELKEFDAAHAIPELATVAKFVEEHPCCDRSELPAGADAEKHLAWLVSTGHVVAFTNGVYSKVEKYPKYGPQWKKRSAAPNESKPKPKSKSEEAPEESKSKEEVTEEESKTESKLKEETMVAEAPVAVETPVAEPASAAVETPAVEPSENIEKKENDESTAVVAE